MIVMLKVVVEHEPLSDKGQGQMQPSARGPETRDNHDTWTSGWPVRGDPS